MEACFNDISVLPVVESNANILLKQYAYVIKSVYVKGYHKIRYNHELSSICLYDNISVRELCKKNIHEPAYQLLLSTFTQPGIDEKNEEIITKYVNTCFDLPTDNYGNKANCFAYAYASNTICVGFASCNIWEQCMHKMGVVANEQKAEIEWPCISCIEHLSSSHFLTWQEQYTPLILLDSQIDPADKKVHITDDHGKNVLISYGEKLRHNRYINEIYSASYKPHTNQFIHEINPNGEVTIVLTNTPQHLSLTLKTTGRNLRETTEIAQIIKRLYKK